MPEGGFADAARLACLLAAEDSVGAVVGYAMFRRNFGSIVVITHLCVGERHRGTGIARLLFQAVLAACADCLESVSAVDGISPRTRSGRGWASSQSEKSRDAAAPLPFGGTRPRSFPCSAEFNTGSGRLFRLLSTPTYSLISTPTRTTAPRSPVALLLIGSASLSSWPSRPSYTTRSTVGNLRRSGASPGARDTVRADRAERYARRNRPRSREGAALHDR